MAHESMNVAPQGTLNPVMQRPLRAAPLVADLRGADFALGGMDRLRRVPRAVASEPVRRTSAVAPGRR